MLTVCKNKNWEVARPGRMRLKKQAEEVGCERVCGKQLEGKVTGGRGRSWKRGLVKRYVVNKFFL